MFRVSREKTIVGELNQTLDLTIREYAPDAVVVAHDENVDQLCLALSREGFRVRVNRMPYDEKERRYSASVRCLLNHKCVWESIIAKGEPALVVEADFVPCVGFGNHAVPFPLDKAENCWGWLYMTGPTVYELQRGKLRGHSASPVATLVCPQAAEHLVQFAEEIIAGEPYEYSVWDTYAGPYLKQRGCPSFLPLRNCGEHGGIPNPEHREAGLRASHRADALAGRLHFVPQYAKGSTLRFLRERILGKFWGVGRLACGRYLPLQTIKDTPSKKDRLTLVWYAVKRHFVIW